MYEDNGVKEHVFREHILMLISDTTHDLPGKSFKIFIMLMDDEHDTQGLVQVMLSKQRWAIRNKTVRWTTAAVNDGD